MKRSSVSCGASMIACALSACAMGADPETTSTAATESVASTNGLVSVNGLMTINGLSIVNGLSVVNGLAAVNGIPMVNGLPALNGLAVINGLSSANGLSVVNGLTSVSDGATLYRYVVKCALPAGHAVVVNGTTYAGAVGMAPEWEWGQCDADCQEKVTSCLLAHVNSSGKHVPLWLTGPDSTGWGQDRANYPYQEAAFFGNLMASQPTAYFCRGQDDGRDVYVQGRLCATSSAGTSACPYHNVGPCGGASAFSSQPYGSQNTGGKTGGCGVNSACPARYDGYSTLTLTPYGNLPNAGVTKVWRHPVTAWDYGSQREY